MTEVLDTDVLVVGSGASGLAAAWHCSQYAKVLLLTKKGLQSGATHWAQGGIAAALGPNDSIQQHIIDTTQTGQDLCYPPIVEKIIGQAPKTIAWLSKLGMPFTLDDQKQFALGQEGAHQYARIAHTADATGQALSTTLIQQVLTHQNIHILPHHIGIDLICKQGRCIGLSILDLDTNNQKIVLAQHVILATGGANKVYLYTTQPESA
ncbi:MAG: FAD-dependent oxidoreductase, partial [Alphaproteobacteria bacterium]|nr:FAD-dependent oxidoreductase [Alphaproteobacteria bacterium]